MGKAGANGQMGTLFVMCVFVCVRACVRMHVLGVRVCVPAGGLRSERHNGYDVRARPDCALCDMTQPGTLCVTCACILVDGTVVLRYGS